MRQLSQQVQELTAANANLAAHQDRVGAHAREAEAALRYERDQLASQVAALEAQLHRMQDEHERRVAELTADIQRLQDENDLQSQRLRAATRVPPVAASGVSVAAITAERDELAARVTDLTADLQRLQEENDFQAQRLAAVTRVPPNGGPSAAALAKVTAERDDMAAHVAELQRRQAEHDREVDALHAELRRLQAAGAAPSAPMHLDVDNTAAELTRLRRLYALIHHELLLAGMSFVVDGDARV